VAEIVCGVVLAMVTPSLQGEISLSLSIIDDIFSYTIISHASTILCYLGIQIWYAFEYLENPQKILSME
jgi:hypothetical protein